MSWLVAVEVLPSIFFHSSSLLECWLKKKEIWFIHLVSQLLGSVLVSGSLSRECGILSIYPVETLLLGVGGSLIYWGQKKAGSVVTWGWWHFPGWDEGVCTAAAQRARGEGAEFWVWVALDVCSSSVLMLSMSIRMWSYCYFLIQFNLLILQLLDWTVTWSDSHSIAVGIGRSDKNSCLPCKCDGSDLSALASCIT